MTNNEIIINQAIAHGIYTKAEAQAIVAAKGCLPIHTFAEWKKAGYSVKRGEHAAITCDLWKYTERPGKAAKAARAEAAKAGQNGPDADAPDPHYYMAKAHLFTLDQVKSAGQDDAPKAKTPEEIAAYNKKLADERKARKAAQQAAAAPAVQATAPGEYSYCYEMQQAPTGCDYAADLAYYGKHYFLRPLRDDLPPLHGRGITYDAEQGTYMVTLRAYDKIKAQYKIKRETCLD